MRRRSGPRYSALFAKVRCVLEALDEAKENKNTVLLPSKVKVWRTFAII